MIMIYHARCRNECVFSSLNVGPKKVNAKDSFARVHKIFFSNERMLYEVIAESASRHNTTFFVAAKGTMNGEDVLKPG